MDAATLISFLQSKGFIWGPEPEVYGGLAGFYTYAPLGKLLKNNVEKSIRNFFQSYNFWEVECPTIMHDKVWEASGHLGNFTDDVTSCTKCKAKFKVETLVDERFPDKKIDNYAKAFKDADIKCPNCGGAISKEITQHNLMMKTTVGSNQEAFLRPETATTTYLPFIRYTDFFRKKFPFGVFQIGKAYRNEISPRQHIIRMREFTQAEAQLFIFKDQKKEHDISEVEKDTLPLISNTKNKLEEMSVKDAIKKKYFKNNAYAWTVALVYKLFSSMGFTKEHLRLKQHSQDEMAFYADDAWDLEIKTNSFGWIECCGIHDRTDYDMKQHEKFSGKSFKANMEGTEKQHPHVLEIAFGVDRPVFCLLDAFFDIKTKGEGKTILKVNPKMSPIKAAVFPLVKKEKLPEIAKELYDELKQYMVCTYDSSGSVGKRYLREAEKGTALCITVDFDTLEKKTVTLRERDSEMQVRVPLNQVRNKVQSYLEGTPFKDLGEKV